MQETFELVRFTEDMTPAVRAFNQRMVAGGIEAALAYPEHHVPRFPHREGTRLFQEQWLLCDRGGNMRGGFILTWELRALRGVEPVWVASLRLPISEGAVDKRYKAVGPLVFEHAMIRQPRLYIVGMGGEHTAVSRRIRSLGWSMAATPFYFKIFSAKTFLATSPYLRKNPWMRMAAGVAAITGAGGLSIAALQFLAAKGQRWRGNPVEADEAAEFGSWADEVWERSQSHYLLIGPRDQASLALRYPAAAAQFLKLRFRRGGCDIGWALMLDTHMRGNKYFGDARVGALVDYLSEPGDAAAVIHGATAYLRERGVDMVVSNQSHNAWRQAFRSCGYIPGPSNFMFAISPQLAEMVSPFQENFGEFFVSRADGAGPERLME